MFKIPVKLTVTRRLLKRKDVKDWPDSAKEEFTVLVGNLIDLYGVSGFLTGGAKKPFQDGLTQIKKKYDLK